MDAIRRDPVTFGAVAVLVASAVLAFLSSSRRRSRALLWVGFWLGAVGMAAVAFEIWFGLTQAR